MPIIETKQLSKEFKIFNRREGLVGSFKDLFTREYFNLNAVDRLDFVVEAGEMVGYIGANGAGKSTTIKMLTGILVPSSGEARVNGFIPHEQRELCTRGLGVVFGQRTQLWWDIAVIESFNLLRRIYQVPKESFCQRVDRFTELLDLAPLLNIPVRKLSLGQRMRCELAAALLHNPPLLFLDEPTIGLDVLAKSKIRSFLKDLNKEYNTTVILTTHDLGDIEALCPRVAIIEKGQMIYDGSRQFLYEQWGQQELEQIVKDIYQGQRPEGEIPHV